jgi:hypothetical protein
MKKRWLAAILAVMLLLVQAVALAGGEDECDHDWWWEVNDTHHLQACEKCNKIMDEGPHTMVPDGEGYKCSVCRYECDHLHDFSGNWVTDDVDHWHKCKHCDAIDGYISHTMVPDGEGYKCSECGYTRNHLHDFSGDWVKDGVDHWHVCKDCDAIDGYKRHTMVSDGESYKCSVCGYTCDHEKHTFDKDGYNGSEHWKICSVEGCGDVDPYSYEEHTLVEDAENVYRCKCGFTTDHTEHSWGEWNLDDENHWRDCTVEGCGAYEIASHDWEPDGENQIKCKTCGYSRHKGDHKWSGWLRNEVRHWKECEIEGCLAISNLEDHKFDSDNMCECGFKKHKHNWDNPIQFDVDDEHYEEYHYCPCTYEDDDYKCYVRRVEPHRFVNGVCECGYIIHEAKGDWKYDEYVHWHECKFDGCTDKLGENEHDLVNGVCRVCGYGKIDYPVYDDVQPVVSAPLPPQTGDASYLAIGIGMIAAALCIALRKRQSN